MAIQVLPLSTQAGPYPGGYNFALVGDGVTDHIELDLKKYIDADPSVGSNTFMFGIFNTTAVAPFPPSNAGNNYHGTYVTLYWSPPIPAGVEGIVTIIPMFTGP